MITDATYSPEDQSLLLCGYDKQGNSFLLFLPSIHSSSPFHDGVERTDITASVGWASQVEGITHIAGNSYFLSRERVNRTVNGILIERTQHLYRFQNGSHQNLSVEAFVPNPLHLYPNPSKDLVTVTGIEIAEIVIIDSSGREVIKQKKSSSQIYIGTLTPGFYFLKVRTTDNRVFSKKIKKH